MAGPLRRVSQDYQWTLKRAHNDLHNSITPDLQPAPAPSKIDTIISPWDSDRLQWKFKIECDELREHLEHSLLILLGWWVTFRYITKATADHFTAHPEQAITNLFNKSAKLSNHVMFLISLTLWNLLTALFRYVMPQVAFHTQPFRANTKGEIDADTEVLLFPRKLVHDEQSIHSTSTGRRRTIHTPIGFKGSPAITVMSDSTQSVLGGPLVGAPKDDMGTLQSTMHMAEGNGSPLLYDVNQTRIPHANEIAGFVDLH